jgi:hypothetical protein
MADAAIQPFEVRNAECGMRKKTISRGAAEIYKLEMINRKSKMGDVADQANGHLKPWFSDGSRAGTALASALRLCWKCYLFFGGTSLRVRKPRAWIAASSPRSSSQ